MKYDKSIANYLDNLTYHLKWNIAIHNTKDNTKMYAYDYDDHRRIAISTLVKMILNDGFIEDLGFTPADIFRLCNLLPIKKERERAIRIFL